MNGRLAIWGALAAVLAMVLAAGIVALMPGPGAAPAISLSVPGDYGAVIPFTLTDRSGRRVGLEDLAGRFWIADFIFTRCTGVCPILTAQMSALIPALSRIPGGEEVRLVSFSVDPAWDSPEVLSRYAAGPAAGAAVDRWLFLTGPSEELHRLIKDGFRLSVAERAPGIGDTAGDLITHSDRFVLVDPAGRIRAYYHGTDEESVRKLLEDLERLLGERPL
jgi:protein SCO1/2